MGFRNPLRFAVDPVARDAATAAADLAKLARTEIIPGSRIAAEAIAAIHIAAEALNGKTITGATIRTAPPGFRRVEVTGGNAERVTFYSGGTDEVVPGKVWSDWNPGEGSTGGDQGVLYVGPPQLGALIPTTTPQAGLTILGQRRDRTSRGKVYATGLGGLEVPDGPLTVAGAVNGITVGDTGWQTITTAVGFTTNGSPSVKLLNGALIFSAGWASTTTPGGAGAMAANSVYNVGQLPAGFIPEQLAHFPAGTSAAANGGMFVIQPRSSANAGQVQIRTGPSVSPYYRLEPGSGIAL